MNPKLAHASVVIVAKHFNPSVINQLWLADHEIVLRDEFEAGSIYTDMMVNVASKKFGLLVAPDQLQFAPRVVPDEQQDLLCQRLSKLIATIPHTPYSACGLNILWHVLPKSIETFGKELFCVPDSPLFRFFDSPDSRFGGYMSCDSIGGRLKLDVKPITAQSPDGNLELMQFGFNFHYEIEQSGAADQIAGILSRWDEAMNRSSEIMTIFEKEISE